jgi:peroxiredoxin
VNRLACVPVLVLALPIAGCNADDDEGLAFGVAPLAPAACSDEPAGREVGDLAEDFELSDQEGRLVRLSDYCGDVIDIQTGSMWCPGCQTEAARLNEQYATWQDQGFVILSILAEDVHGEPVTAEALQAWVDTYDLTTPVLGDPDGHVIHRYFTHEGSRELLIGRDGRIRNLRFALNRDVEAALSE